MVCCGSAFPQLFTSSTKKPEFSPSETFLRMRSRMRSPRKRQPSDNDTTLLNFTGLSQNSTSQFNSQAMVTHNSGTNSAYPERGSENGPFGTKGQPKEGPAPFLNGPGPMSSRYTSIRTSPHEIESGPDNQIIQHFEFERKESRHNANFQ
ncbi:hypothetical protein PG993_013674 [Apiospora rasikravindrae]|uniref:Uncharacterized protein n=1 Tax=Apiospora rasikravindrae TaxID=990691 RepID=A0ABR1RQY9_9PEZI